jgi:hypothetical protein
MENVSELLAELEAMIARNVAIIARSKLIIEEK